MVAKKLEADIAVEKITYGWKVDLFAKAADGSVQAGDVLFEFQAGSLGDALGKMAEFVEGRLDPKPPVSDTAAEAEIRKKVEELAKKQGISPEELAEKILRDWRPPLRSPSEPDTD